MSHRNAIDTKSTKKRFNIRKKHPFLTVNSIISAREREISCDIMSIKNELTCAHTRTQYRIHSNESIIRFRIKAKHPNGRTI